VLEPGRTPSEGRAAEHAYAKGDQLGPFVIVERIGEGGMGVVYSGYDPRLDRKVALKLLRSDSRRGKDGGGRRRLLREAHALARLSHENIVVVHEAGEFNDQVYVAMEYVAGGTLRDWVRSAEPTWQEIVDRYVRAGRGLQAAHRAGLVHRDFKPENVLAGDDGKIRVTDFGLVQGTSGPGADEVPAERRARFPTSVPMEAQTDHRHVAGTPGYLAPEIYRHQPADPNSDQYAFSVALHEALCGEKPFLGNTLAEIVLSQCHDRTKPAPKECQVPGRVLEILRKGYAFEPSDRHPSMAVLLGALEECHVPNASPAKRIVLAVAALGVAAAVVFLVWSRAGGTNNRCAGVGKGLADVWNDSRRGQVATALDGARSPLRQDASERTLVALDRYARDWMTMRRDACEATHVRREQSASVLDLRMACLDRRLAEFDSARRVLGETSDAATARNAVFLATSLTPLAACADVAGLTAPVPLPADAKTRRRVTGIVELVHDGLALSRVGKYRPALAKTQAAVTAARALGWPRTLANALLVHGNLLDDAGDAKQARSMFAKALPLAAKAKDDRLVAELHVSLLGLLQRNKSDLKQALSSRPIIDAAISRAGDPPILRIKYLHFVGGIYDRAGNYSEALAFYRRGLALARSSVGANHPLTATLLNDAAVVMDVQGSARQALALYRRALEVEQLLYGRHHPRVARALNNTAVTLAALSQYKAAEASYRRALGIWRSSYGDNHTMVGVTQLNLGVARQALKDWGGAERAYRAAIKTWVRAKGQQREHLATALNNLGDLFENRGNCAKALAPYGRALSIWEASLGKKHPDLAYALAGLGSCRLSLGQAKSAVEPLERALRLRVRAKVDADEIAQVQFLLARALVDTSGDAKRARDLAKAALVRYTKSNAETGAKARMVKSWLDKIK